MIFEAIEDNKRGYPNGRRFSMGPIIRDKATIEHIMPQKWQQNWPAELTEDEQAEREHRIQQLGNLTIVTQALNTRVSNGSWQTKRAHFLEADDVLITKDAINLAGDGEWNESLIEERTSNLIDRILELWPVPEGTWDARWRSDCRETANPSPSPSSSRPARSRRALGLSRAGTTSARALRRLCSTMGDCRSLA